MKIFLQHLFGIALHMIGRHVYHADKVYVELTPEYSCDRYLDCYEGLRQ